MQRTKKLTIEQVCKTYEQYDCKLLETEYVNAHQPMKYKCKCGNIYQKKYYAFRKHPFCNNCGKTCKLTQEEAILFYKRYECGLLEKYKPNVSLRFKCKCGKISNKTFKAFKIKQKCNNCSERHFYTFNEVKGIFKKAKCKLLESEYKNTHAKMNYQCKCNNISAISLDKFLQGKRCNLCGIRSGKNNGNWNPDREFVKLNQIIGSRSSSRVKGLLKSQGKTKQYNKKSYLGYSTEELKNRLINHPNWDNVKNDKWHIDHIFPVKAFLQYNISDIKLINSLDNLQPLSQMDNLLKSAKYNKDYFVVWLATKGVVV